MSMLRSRNSGGRLVRSNPRQNTKPAPRPQSMQKGGITKSAPRKMQFGSTPQCRRGWVYDSYEKRCVPIRSEDAQVGLGDKPPAYMMEFETDYSDED